MRTSLPFGGCCFEALLLTGAMLMVEVFATSDAAAVESAKQLHGPPLDFSIEAVDATGNVRRWTSIAIGPDGAPQIAYFQAYVPYPISKLRWGRRLPDGWLLETVTTFIGTWSMESACSLALDSNGSPWIAFHGNRIATQDEHGWISEYIDGCVGPDHVAIASGADGVLQVCLQGSCSGGIYYGYLDYAFRSNDHWNVTTVEESAYNFAVRGYSSIAVDHAGSPHIAVFNETAPSVRYFYRSEDAWNVEGIGPGTTNSIALDAGGVPHVTYYDPSSHTLKIATRQSTAWSISTVDDSGDVGSSAALDVGPDATLHIAYYDATNADLKYARRERLATAWSIQVVDSIGDVGSGVSLKVDRRNTVHIAYYDRTRGELRYCHGSAVVAVEPTTWSRAKEFFRKR